MRCSSSNADPVCAFFHLSHGTSLPEPSHLYTLPRSRYSLRTNCATARVGVLSQSKCKVPTSRRNIFPVGSRRIEATCDILDLEHRLPPHKIQPLASRIATSTP